MSNAKLTVKHITFYCRHGCPPPPIISLMLIFPRPNRSEHLSIPPSNPPVTTHSICDSCFSTHDRHCLRSRPCQHSGLVRAHLYFPHVSRSLRWKICLARDNFLLELEGRLQNALQCPLDWYCKACAWRPQAFHIPATLEERGRNRSSKLNSFTKDSHSLTKANLSSQTPLLTANHLRPSQYLLAAPPRTPPPPLPSNHPLRLSPTKRNLPPAPPHSHHPRNPHSLRYGLPLRLVRLERSHRHARPARSGIHRRRPWRRWCLAPPLRQRVRNVHDP